MSSTSNYLAVASNHINSLIEYVKDAKPYHTKLSQVVEEYQFDEAVRVHLTDASSIVAFLGADLADRDAIRLRLLSNPTASRPISKSWLREAVSNGVRRQWPAPTSLFHKHARHFSQDIFTCGVDDDTQIVGLTTGVFNQKRWNGAGIPRVTRNGVQQQEGIGYYLSYGVHAFNIHPNQEWRQADLESVSAFARQPGVLFYNDVISAKGTVKNIVGGNYEEWTLRCTNDSTGEVEVSGSTSGIIGTALFNATFTHALVSFDYVGAPGETTPSLSVDDTITLTPWNKVTVHPSAPEETWSLIKTNPLALVAAPVFNSLITRTDAPGLEVFTSSLARVTEAQVWTITFNGDGTYNLSKLSVSDSYTVSNIDLLDGCAYKSDDIAFTIIPSKTSFIAGESFNFSVKPAPANYLVYGSISGWQEPAIVNTWYWNGKVGFKIPALDYFVDLNADDFTTPNNFVALKPVNQVAEPCVYTIKFVTDTQASVECNIGGFKRSLTLDQPWDDGLVSFKITNIPGEHIIVAGDVIRVWLTPLRTFATNDAYDDVPYSETPYDTAYNDVTRPSLFNQEVFPLQHSHGSVIFPVIANGDTIGIDKIYSDTVYLKIEGASARYPELSPVDDWIPLDIRFYDRVSGTTPTSNAEFADTVTYVEALCASDPLKPVFTISQPRYSDTDRVASATLTIDADFFAAYLPFGTNYAFYFKQEESYGQTIRVKFTENVRAYVRVRLTLDELLLISVVDAPIQHYFIVSDLTFAEAANFHFIEGGALPVRGGYDLFPYDAVPLDSAFINGVVSGFTQIAPDQWDYTADPNDWTMPFPTTTPSISVEHTEAPDTAGTTFVEGLSITNFNMTTGQVEALSTFYDVNVYPSSGTGMLISEPALSYVITHNGSSSTPNVLAESVANPGTWVSMSTNPFTYLAGTSTQALVFSLPPGFTAPFRLLLV